MSRILLICSEPDTAAAAELATRTLAACAAADRPTLRTQSVPDLAQLKVKHSDADAVWLYAGPSIDRSTLYAALDIIEEWRCPTLVTRHDDALPIGTAVRDGVLAAPADACPERLGLMLCSLLSQGQVMRTMKQEAEIMRRQQSGMSHQMDKIDEELRLAAKLQRQFLPQRLPQIPGVLFDVLFRPCSYCSGDIYDVQQLSSDITSFYVADAVGHGVPAALLTMFIKQSLQGRENGERLGRIIPLPEAMSRLNRDLLARQATQVQFITACYGRYNHKSRELQIVRAGHPPPMLMRHDGTIESLTPDGPLLGVFEDGTFDVLTTTLDPGDRLLIYSDGFELAFMGATNPDDPQYMQELRALRTGTLPEAMARLHSRLDAESGSLHQRDDLTAVLIDVALAA